MYIYLYRCTDDPRTIDKKNLAEMFSADGKLKEETSILNPVITMRLLLYPRDPNATPVHIVTPEDSDYINRPVVFNYAYIPAFKRYYFVTDVIVLSENLFTIYLRVDPLMSFKNSIIGSSIFHFVERMTPVTGVTFPVLDDPFISWSDKETVTLTDIVSNFTQTYKNITFDPQTGNDDVDELRVVLYSTVKYAKRNALEAFYDGHDYNYGSTPWEVGAINPPVIAGNLPQISANVIQTNALDIPYVLSIKQMNMIQRGLDIDDATISFIISAVSFPFVIPSSFYTTLYYDIYIGDASFSIPPLVQPTIMSAHVIKSACVFPYLILCEFECPTVSSYEDFPNHATYDVYLPYYGWTPLDVVAFSGDHFMVFYAISLIDGAGSVNLFDTTKGSLVFTAPVQIGRKVILSTSNERENNIQSQNIALNGVLGGIGAVLGVVGGAIIGGPVGAVAAIGATATGIGAIAKSAINSQSVIARGSISFGSEATNFFSPVKAYLRKKQKTPAIAYGSTDMTTFYKTHGKPLKKSMSLYANPAYPSGTFVLLSNVHIDSETATKKELDEIKSILESGAYL